MEVKTVSLPEDAIIGMLKALPEDVLANIFWKAMIDYDPSPISDDEQKLVLKARSEFEKGETFSWKDIR